MKLLPLLIAGAIGLHAFEQGSYHVFDLLETPDAPPIAGRLAVPENVLAEKTSKDSPAPSLVERSEFVINYSQTMQGTSNPAFEFKAPMETAEEPASNNFSTDTFDFSRSQTVFGE